MIKRCWSDLIIEASGDVELPCMCNNVWRAAAIRHWGHEHPGVGGRVVPLDVVRHLLLPAWPHPTKHKEIPTCEELTALKNSITNSSITAWDKDKNCEGLKLFWTSWTWCKEYASHLKGSNFMVNLALRVLIHVLGYYTSAIPCPASLKYKKLPPWMMLTALKNLVLHQPCASKKHRVFQ